MTRGKTPERVYRDAFPDPEMLRQLSRRRGGNRSGGLHPEIPRQVYLVRRPDGLIKIGYSKHVHKRLKVLASRWGTLHTLLVFSGDCNTEAALHRKYTHRRVDGEWFALTDEDIATIRDIAAQAAPEGGSDEQTR